MLAETEALFSIPRNSYVDRAQNIKNSSKLLVTTSHDYLNMSITLAVDVLRSNAVEKISTNALGTWYDFYLFYVSRFF